MFVAPKAVNAEAAEDAVEAVEPEDAVDAMGAVEEAGRIKAFGSLPEGWQSDVLFVRFFFAPKQQ